MSTPCSSSTIFTGAAGNVTCDNIRIARITSWSINPTFDDIVFADSTSTSPTADRHFKNHFPGRGDATGTVEFHLDTNFPQYSRLIPGECCALALFIDPTTYWSITEAVILSASYTVNVEDLDVLEGSIDFVSNGAYFYPGETGALVRTLPASPA